MPLFGYTLGLYERLGYYFIEINEAEFSISHIF